MTVTGLSKTYGNGVRALDRVDLTIGRGLFGLLGPNGAGKSTLMRTIAALQEPDEGTIALDGLDVLAEPQELRRRLGYLPQDFGVYPGISALLLLDHIAVLKGIQDKQARREQVHALLELTNLYEVRNKAVSTFSGGMRQRFGIAQALLGAPSLIIVDEPTAGLDPEERSRFHNLLSEIGENAVVLLSTHIVEDVSDHNKAAVVLWGLRDLLGQEAMDRAIRVMMQERRPTSLDLVNHLHAVADARQRTLIDQWTKKSFSTTCASTPRKRAAAPTAAMT